MIALLIAGLLFVDTSQSYDYENRKLYGNCAVLTAVDMFTDKRMPYLVCIQETIGDQTWVGIGDDDGDGNLDVLVSKGVQLRFTHTVDIRLRIDKGPVIARTATWVGGQYARIPDPILAVSLLDDLAQGYRAVVQVGNERGNIILKGSAAAVQDLRQRLESSGGFDVW